MPANSMYMLSWISSQDKLLVRKNSSRPQKLWEHPLRRMLLPDHFCAHIVYIACTQTIHLSFLSYPLMYWTNWCPSAIITQTKCSYSLHKDSHRGGFPLHFPSRPHKGDPFQPLLAAPLSAFRSLDSLPWGYNWWKKENKDTRWMLGEFRLVANRHFKPIPQWLDGFCNAWQRKRNWYWCWGWPRCLVWSSVLHAFWELV